ncbi:SMI1/KNR4 family protein [Clostridium estertheticum]|uniref:SMI1/KNR4 family protein n=1 Tax=Clostridium estertheticum TaxID=238834 RepID=UPI001C7D4B74|nr:SMI1/KNR4 family protein [Clostridium estertheticum]MBX4262270.1 SMI1/KNR4 family protein [Clostridium estertheticum]WLC71994.1 SMI1/KNR4 family protein [Clostridium estertheticum]
MFNNKFIGVEKALKEYDLIFIEEKYNFKFPNKVKEYYLQYNGGEPEKYIFIDEDEDSFIVQKFVSIKYNSGGGQTLENYIQDIKEDAILPKWLIPFAYDPGGDIYCFSIDKEDNGAIYYWSHEHDLEEDTEEHVVWLSESMESFINNMTN